MKNSLVPVKKHIAEKALIKSDEYESLYRESIENPEKFWGHQAERIHWEKKWSQVKKTSFKGDISIEWFLGGKLNACANCVDRHLPQRANQTALIFEPDNPQSPGQKITYQELHEKVCRFANVLKKRNVKKKVIG